MVDVNDTVTFDASGSMFSQSQSKAGLLFRWVCPESLQIYCDLFLYQSKLEIHAQAFK